jgi:hypothetical protein
MATAALGPFLWVYLVRLLAGRNVDDRLGELVGSLGRLGWFLIRISLPRLRVLMLSNPLNRAIFRNRALDYFRFAIGPQNIDSPARSGIFPSQESWSLLEHPRVFA